MARNKKETEFNQITYQNNYIKEKYDQVRLLVPKGNREKIKARAEAKGMSVNEYINRLIENDNK